MGDDSFLAVPPYLEEEGDDDDQMSDPLGADEQSPDPDTVKPSSVSMHDAWVDYADAVLNQQERTGAVGKQPPNNADPQQTSASVELDDAREADAQDAVAETEAMSESPEHEPPSPDGDVANSTALEDADDLGHRSPAAGNEDSAAPHGSNGDVRSCSDDDYDGVAEQPQGSASAEQQEQQLQREQLQGSTVQESDLDEGEDQQQQQSPELDGGHGAGSEGASEDQPQMRLGDQGEQMSDGGEDEQDFEEEEEDLEVTEQQYAQNHSLKDEQDEGAGESEADDVMEDQQQEQQQLEPTTACPSFGENPSVLLSGSQTSLTPSINLVSGDASDQGDNMPDAEGTREASTAINISDNTEAGAGTDGVQNNPFTACKHGTEPVVPSDPAAECVPEANGGSNAGQTPGQLATAHAAKNKISYNEWKQPDPSASASKQLNQTASPWKQPDPNGSGWGDGPGVDIGGKAQAGAKDSGTGKSGKGSGGGATAAALGKGGALKDSVDGSKGKTDVGVIAVGGARDHKGNPDSATARTEDRSSARLERDRDPAARNQGVCYKSAGGKGFDERDPRRSSATAAAAGSDESARLAYQHSTRLSLDERDKLREGDKSASVPKGRAAYSEPRQQREVAPSAGRDRGSPVAAGQWSAPSALTTARGAQLITNRTEAGHRSNLTDGPLYMQPPVGHTMGTSYQGQWHPQGHAPEPPRITKQQYDQRQTGQPQFPFNPSDRPNMIGRDIGGTHDASGRSPLNRIPDSNQRPPMSPPLKRGQLSNYPQLEVPLRYRSDINAGIRSDQISNQVRGPGIQTQGQTRPLNEHHQGQQRQDLGDGIRNFPRPALQPEFNGHDNRQRDNGSGPFLYPDDRPYSAGRDSPVRGSGPYNLMPIPRGPVGPPSMQHRLSSQHDFYLDGGPNPMQQEQQRRSQQQQQDPWMTGAGPRDIRGDRLEGVRGQQSLQLPPHERTNYAAQQREQQPLDYPEQRGTFRRDSSPVQHFARPEPRHPPPYEREPPYSAPHPLGQLRVVQAPGQAVGGYTQQRRHEPDTAQLPHGYPHFPSKDYSRGGDSRQESGLDPRQRDDHGFNTRDNRRPSDQGMGPPPPRQQQRTPPASPERYPGPTRQQQQPAHQPALGGSFPRGSTIDGREEDRFREHRLKQQSDPAQRGHASRAYPEERNNRRSASPPINIRSPTRPGDRQSDRPGTVSVTPRVTKSSAASPRRAESPRKAGGQSSVPEGRSEPRRQTTAASAAAVPIGTASPLRRVDPSSRIAAAVATADRAAAEKGPGTRAKEGLTRDARDAPTAGPVTLASKPARARSPTRHDSSPPSKRPAASRRSPVPSSSKSAASSQAQGRSRERSPVDRAPARNDRNSSRTTDAAKLPAATAKGAAKYGTEKSTNEKEDRRGSKQTTQPDHRSSRAKTPPPSAARISQASILPAPSRRTENFGVAPSNGYPERRLEAEQRPIPGEQVQDRMITDRRDQQPSQQQSGRQQQQQQGDRAAEPAGREGRDGSTHGGDTRSGAGRSSDGSAAGRRQNDSRQSDSRDNARKGDGRTAEDVVMREQVHGSGGSQPVRSNQTSAGGGRDVYDIRSKQQQQQPQQLPQQQFNGWGEVVVPGSVGSHYGGGGRGSGGPVSAQQVEMPGIRSNGASDFARGEQQQQPISGYSGGREAQQNGLVGRARDGYAAGGSNNNNARQAAATQPSHASAQSAGGGYVPITNGSESAPSRGHAWPAQQGAPSLPLSNTNSANRLNGNTGQRGAAGGGLELEVVENTILQVSDNAQVWYYIDPKGEQQGPCTVINFKAWLGYLEKPGEGMDEECKRFKTVEVWHTNMPNRLPLDKMLRIRQRAGM